MSSRGRICFYVPYVYPVAAEEATPFVGGSEVRQWALARGLAERGFDVAIATCDFGQGDVVVRDGVQLLRTFSTQAGIPVLRLFYPRLWKAMRTLRRANADVYLASGSGQAAGWAYDAARLRGAKFVWLSASDGDALPSLPWLTKRRERWWYLRALHGADARIAQTEVQSGLFRTNFGVETQVIANPVDLPATPVDASQNDAILWLSTYKPTKRPEWFIELARRLPQLRFVMVGLPGSGDAAQSWEEARRAASGAPNLEVHGFVEHSRIGEILCEAALFVHTSPAEGFPMTLLEAWSYGVPSVTTFDPGGVITRHGLGESVRRLEDLIETVSAVMATPSRRKELGLRARAYVERHHGPEETFEPLATLLDRLIQGRRGRTDDRR
jgi:glycosyltransferase involved in cell wall biosynthesis